MLTAKKCFQTRQFILTQTTVERRKPTWSNLFPKKNKLEKWSWVRKRLHVSTPRVRKTGQVDDVTPCIAHHCLSANHRSDFFTRLEVFCSMCAFRELRLKMEFFVVNLSLVNWADRPHAPQQCLQHVTTKLLFRRDPPGQGQQKKQNVFFNWLFLCARAVLLQSNPIAKVFGFGFCPLHRLFGAQLRL